MTEEKQHDVFIALGSNLGKREDNLLHALEYLSQYIQIKKKSSIYETPPWGVLDQPSFLNQVIKGSTGLTPQELLVDLKRIEKLMGRVKTIRFGPRVIDLDILLYDEIVLILPNLVIPHPRMCERAFVLVPLAEIAPLLPIPGTGRNVSEILSQVDSSGIRMFANKENNDDLT